MSTINKIRVGSTEYDIAASSIGDLSSINIESNSSTKTPEITVKTTNTSNPVVINLDAKSSKSSVADAEGYVHGTIQLNEKGNLAVESLSKHVNIEAKQAIQLKPTTNLIFDTSRRKEAQQQQGKDGNEGILEIKWDDSTSENDIDKYSPFKIHSRAIDLRCFNHGGIALQPCGVDGAGKENKIKFESSRLVSANTTIPSGLDRNSANYSEYYTTEGGKGVEFATFNNEHTSIFSKDYRFNKDGKVFAVVRGNVVADGSKRDYPTQPDDFKDIPVDNDGFSAVYDSGWKVNTSLDTHGDYLISSTWNSIVKTGHALNDQPWTDCNISGKGNLQITAADEIQWVSAPTPAQEVPDDHQLKAGKDEPKRKYVGNGVYKKKSDGSYWTCELIENGEHHLNLEADSTIKLESGFNDIELVAGDKVQATAPNIQLEATNTVDFSTTPTVSFMHRKVTKEGGFESCDAVLKITSLNNFKGVVYENTSTQKIRIPYDKELYVRTTNGDNEFVYTNFVPALVSMTKPTLCDSENKLAKEGTYFFESNLLTLSVSVDATGLGGKKSKVCKYTNSNLYTDSGHTTPFIVGNELSAVNLYDNSGNQAVTGYHVVKNNLNKDCIIYVDTQGKLAQYLIDNSGDGVMGWYLEMSAKGVTNKDVDYTDIIFGGSDSAESGEVAKNQGDELQVGNIECLVSDIATLVEFFKTGEGRANGPWKE